MKLRLALALSTSALLASLASPAIASADQAGWGLSGAVTYALIDDEAERIANKDGIGFRVGVSRPMASWLTLEVLAGYQFFDYDNAIRPAGFVPSAQDEYSLTLDYQFHVLPKIGSLSPYLVAGVGIARTADAGPSNITSTDALWNAGIGADLPITDSFGLAADIKYRPVYWEGDLDPADIVVSLGFTYDLSSEPMIMLGGDKADADGDGVPDGLDRCPNTTAGAVVDAYGCEVSSAIGDADGDGVPDNMDRCPNTPAGTPVDAEGCAAPETVVIYFAFDSSELNGPARNALDIVADNLKSRSYVVAVANGHADRTGTEAYNQALSERRAKAVADYLVSAGVPQTQLRTRAFGETRPATAGDTPEQRARNRRVEINLIEE